MPEREVLVRQGSREERRGDDRPRLPADTTVYAAEVFDGYSDLYVYVCPYCRKQYRGPGGHRVGGDDLATSCFHRRPGERGLTQPRLIRVRVEPAEPFIPLPIPADRRFGTTKAEGPDA